MKKGILVFATLLLFLGNGPVSADNNPLTDLKKVDRLDLETAIKMTVDNSYNLSLLQLKFNALDNKQDDLKAQMKDLPEPGSVSSYRLPTSPADIVSDPKYGIPNTANPEQLLWLGPTIEANTVINKMMDGMGDIVEGMNKLIRSQRNQLEIAIEQMDTNKKTTLVETDKAKEAAKLQMTSEYVTLLSKKEQIETTKEYIELLENDVVRAQSLEKSGGGSKENIVKTTRAVREQKEQLEILEKAYQVDLVQLSFDLGIEYKPDLILEEVTLTEPQPVERKERNQILAKSYDIKIKYNDIEQARWEEIHTNTSGEDGKDYLDISTRIKEMQGEQLLVEQAKKIDQVYNEAETAYLQVLSATEQSKDALEDYNNNYIRFEKGFISAFDMNKLKFTLTQAQTKEKLAKLKYFALTQKVSSMENGLII
ncbi:TolC family protein [Paenibacillus sp. alder61]|uniref:TolC family protein n=1 Tax=Paenibacillus faecis TaxID=862114 RepID=A0A5D0CUE8_9BACL|nr:MULTISPECIES: TolC family protein [Paenibacillus]MCA1294640.1 TolC family protein [Paenibacillus sp. alder61]TYA13358.1 TolC family protein [Paenibacillus faecis]